MPPGLANSFRPSTIHLPMGGDSSIILPRSRVNEPNHDDQMFGSLPGNGFDILREYRQPQHDATTPVVEEFFKLKEKAETDTIVKQCSFFKT